MNNEAKQVDVSQMTAEQKDAMFLALSAERNKEQNKRKDAYEGIKKDLLTRVEDRVRAYIAAGEELKDWLRSESDAFYEVMKEYGKLRTNEQLGFQTTNDTFKMQVKGNKVKGFDERADIAEQRLVDFLQKWVEQSEKGVKDPMYKLAMMMIQRNGDGDLDYKSISRLYELESDFNDLEYSEIMELFKESNVVEKTSINFYFEEKDKYNQWRKLEPSFNRMGRK